MRKPDILGTGYWHLRKGLYGLRPSGWQWYLDLNTKLQSIGFTRLESDWSIHIQHVEEARSMAATNVNNMLISSSTVMTCSMPGPDPDPASARPRTDPRRFIVNALRVASRHMTSSRRAHLHDTRTCHGTRGP